MTGKRYTALLLLVLMVLVVYLPHFLDPIGELDAVWTFSQAFAFKQGFWEMNPFLQMRPGTLFGLLPLPLLNLYQGKYIVHLFYFIFTTFIALFLWKKLSTSLWLLVISLILISDPTMLVQRSESVLFILSIPILSRHLNIQRPTQFIWLSLFFFTAIFIHPLDTLFLAIAYLSYHRYLYRSNQKWGYILFYGLVTLFLLILSGLEPWDNNSAVLIGRLNSLKPEQLIRFLSYSGIGLVALLYVSGMFGDARRILNFAILTLFVFLGQGHYYFLYLFIPPLLYLLEKPRVLQSPMLLVPALAFNLLISVIHPLFSQMENPPYQQNSHAILKELDSLETDRRVYIENYYAVPVLSKGIANSRMLLMDGGHEYPMDRLQPGDIAVIHYPSKRAIMEKMIKEADLEYEIEERISPVRGKLTLRSLYFSRSDSLGLWLYTLKKSEP